MKIYWKKFRVIDLFNSLICKVVGHSWKVFGPCKTPWSWKPAERCNVCTRCDVSVYYGAHKEVLLTSGPHISHLFFERELDKVKNENRKQVP